MTQSGAKNFAQREGSYAGAQGLSRVGRVAVMNLNLKAVITLRKNTNDLSAPVSRLYHRRGACLLLTGRGMTKQEAQRGIDILAKSVYRDLKQNGYARADIVAFASSILEHLTNDARTQPRDAEPADSTL